MLASAPPVLVFGGGWGAEHTQASIEADVKALFGAMAPGQARVLFADGGRGRAVQTATVVDATSLRLGLVLGRQDGLGATYRPVEMATDGEATLEVLAEALAGLGQRMDGGVVFGAGHGSPAAEEPASLDLWDGPLDVPSLAALLDEMARGPVLFVLGQCHSGAFARIVHEGARVEAPLARPTRCVLAAAPPEREASGCSPDASREASKAFLRTLVDGLSGAGDYDGDGSVTLDEALAFTRIHDPSVDVPVRSSELWLAGLDAPEPGSARVFLGGGKTRARESWFAQADAAERAVLEALFEGAEVFEVQQHLRALRAEAEALDTRFEAAEAEFLDRQAVAYGRLLEAWPELAHPYHPKTRALLAGDASSVVAVWDADPGPFLALEAADAQVSGLSERRWALERSIARAERWMWVASSVIRRQALEPARAAELAALRACERRALPIRTD